MIRKLEAASLAKYQASVALLIATRGEAELANPDDMREEFDEWLLEEPEPADEVDAERHELLVALGLR